MEYTATTTVDTAPLSTPNNSNDVMCIDTAAAMLSTDSSTLNFQPFIYSHDEIQHLLEEAELEGWREGMEEGYKAGKKQGVNETRKK